MNGRFYLRGILIAALMILVGALSSNQVAHAQAPQRETVVYGEIEGHELLLDVYQAPASDAPRPAVILIHGGAGALGERSELASHARGLAAAGYVAFNIEYRLVSGERNRWPAQLEDAQLAVRWIRANAALYNVDPERICALGHSSGGQLAALLGERDTSDHGSQPLSQYSSRVACVIDLAGSVDPTQPVGVDIGGLFETLMGGTASEVPERYQDASALAQVSADTAPFLIFHGAADDIIPVEESRRMVDALHDAGVMVVYAEYPHADHFYWIFTSNPWDLIGPETLAFLARTLQ